MLRRVGLVRTEVTEKHSASFIRMTRIGELGTTLAVSSNRRTLRATRRNIPEDSILHSHRCENLTLVFWYFTCSCWHVAVYCTCSVGCTDKCYCLLLLGICLTSLACSRRKRIRYIFRKSKFYIVESARNKLPWFWASSNEEVIDRGIINVDIGWR
jgi:hypothetical protein